MKSKSPLCFLAVLVLLVSGCSTRSSDEMSSVPDSAQLEASAPIGVAHDESLDGRAIVAKVAPKAPAQVEDIRIVLHTSRGQIEALLFAKKAPVTVASFLNLVKRGYYDGLTFHRVVPNFMIQGGDPTGTGRGGPGYRFENEIHPMLSHNKAGIFSMANAGPDTNGSQFFITHKATIFLDGKHPVFGQVTDGQRVVDSIRQGATIEKIDILDSADVLFLQESDRILEWNRALEANGF